MKDSEALAEMLGLIGRFNGMPNEHIQVQNQKPRGSKPFTAPKGKIWAQVGFKSSGKYITSIADKPCTRSTGMIYVQLFAPLNDGMLDAAELADQWADHLQFYRFEGLELLASEIIPIDNNPDFYQVNVHTPYTVN